MSPLHETGQAYTRTIIWWLFGEIAMGTYIPYKFSTLWVGGLDDRLAFAIYGSPECFRVAWGDGTVDRYRQDYDQNQNGTPDAALAIHRYAEDGLYTIAVRPAPNDDLPPRQLRAHVHSHGEQGAVAIGNDRDEMFLMGQHADRVRTGDGFNWVSAGDGDDRVTGGNGTDVVDGGAGDDRLNGGGGSDQLYGGTGADVMKGGSGSDYLRGGDGDDRVYAEAGGGYLFGDAGGDLLVGGDDGDVLDGGAGVDRLTGGAGGDIFTFGRDGPERDIITDWGNEGPYARDYMDLSQWGVGLTFIGTGRFSGAGREVRYAHTDHATIVFGDVDGDTVADFSIALIGSVTLSRDDFLL